MIGNINIDMSHEGSLEAGEIDQDLATFSVKLVREQPNLMTTGITTTEKGGASLKF